MKEGKIRVEAKRRKDLKNIVALLQDLGYSSIETKGESVTIQKLKGEDLKGKPLLDYRVELKNESVVLTYIVYEGRTKLSRVLEVLPPFLDILNLLEDNYELKPFAIFQEISIIIKELTKMVDREAIEFSAQLSELGERHQDLKNKYEDLVRSSEANSRILLEYEHKNEELEKRITQLRKVSDESLREMLYDWIRIHGGSIDVREFSKANQVPFGRVEEGLNMLIGNGIIRRRT
ncbi:hypothetical protein HY990_03070 [Candidatus Micrarchaeota archaeon]|nr:hypothetical protein [Candidatus Micrarchaeota archaeon]